MKAWHIAVAAVGVGAAWYIYRSTGGGFASVPVTPVPPATGPAFETRSGPGHFAGATPLVASGPASEARAGVKHF